jgi:spermidine synthase
LVARTAAGQARREARAPAVGGGRRHPRHSGFYTETGLRDLRRHLSPGGVFALWSDDPPDEEFLRVLHAAFPVTRAEVVEFANPLTGGTSANTVYVAGS